jgi:hypothetical protein
MAEEVASCLVSGVIGATRPVAWPAYGCAAVWLAGIASTKPSPNGIGYSA